MSEPESNLKTQLENGLNSSEKGPESSTEAKRLKTMTRYQERAFAIPVTGPYQDFAGEVRRLIGWSPDSAQPWMSLRQVRIKTGLAISTLRMMTSGYQVLPGTIADFAEAFGADPKWLAQLAGRISPEEASRASVHKTSPPFELFSEIGDPVSLSQFNFPVSSSFASAGEAGALQGGSIEGTAEELLPGDVHGIRVRGDCMEPLFKNGDIVFVRETPVAMNGDIVIARVGGETLSCKVYHQSSMEAAYLASNGGYEPATRISENFVILGVVEGFTRLKGRDGWQK